MSFLKPFVAILIALYSMSAYGNDLSIDNVSLGAQEMTLNTQELTFDVAWQNSWRTSTLESNYDAVWIFMKYRIQGASDWSHATLMESTAAVPAGSEIVLASDGKGLFVQRDTNGIGDVSFVGCEVYWDRAADGVPALELVEICLIGIQMVFVNGGGYELGDGSPFRQGTLASKDSLPFSINSETAIDLGGIEPLALYSLNTSVQSPADDFSSLSPEILPASFPKGVNGFYQMKYEVDQGLYVQMLNKLNAAQASVRFMNTNSFGNTIISNGNPTAGFSTTTPDRPCNFLNWADFSALADWVGLRPMTELEYEKSCRGDIAAVSDETPSGSILGSYIPFNILDQGLPSEYIDNTEVNASNHIYVFTQVLDRPLRTGIFAASSTNSTRIETGASRYGAMELGGNVWEQVVSIGVSEGRSFTGTHGDGQLDVNGNADQPSWPGTNALGSGIRGGGIYSTDDKIRVSDRVFSNFAVVVREPDVGGRFVRSAN